MSAIEFWDVYMDMYGALDASGVQLVDERIANGWTPDDFKSWLRMQDRFCETDEYRRKQHELRALIACEGGN